MAPILRPLGMAMALVNDYYSFDKECAVHLLKQQQQQSTDGTNSNDHQILYNAVAYLMREEGLSVDAAKDALRNRILDFEVEFRRLRHAWLLSGVPGDDADRLKRFLSYAEWTAGGSAYWHAKAPRYHAETRGDVDSLASLTSRSTSLSSPGVDEVNSVDLTGDSGIITSSPGMRTVGSANSNSYDLNFLEPPKHPVYQPYEYIASLPSKGVREQFATSLNMWLEVPQDKLTAIKAVISILHSTSLM